MRRTASTAEETEALAANLAKALPPDAALKVVYLSGDLGAGKTTFARGFLRERGVRGIVRSPTYTLVEAYPLGPTTFLHLDLYRLSEPSELENLGLRDWMAAGYVWLIEWPERGAGRLPLPDVRVRLSAEETQHVIEVAGASALGLAWMAALEA